MKIEPGKYYRTRDGHKVGPMEESEFGDPGGFWVDRLGLYRKDGTFGYGYACYCHELDIVAEWTDERDPELTSPYGDGNHPLPPTTGTLRELNVKPGDVVEWIGYEDVGPHTLDYIDDDCYVFDTPKGPFAHMPYTDKFRIISRASTYDPEQEVDQLRNERDALQAVIDGKPKTWGEMTDAEQRDVSHAAMKGKTIELDAGSFGWAAWDGMTPLCLTHQPIRIRTEPKIETVTLYAGDADPDCDPTPIGTIDLIDGEPDLDSIKMERV